MKADNQLSILVTRPARQNEQLRQLLEDIQLKPVLFPTIAIQDLWSQELEYAFQQLNTFDIVIFTSNNAVLHSEKFIKQYWPVLPRHCQFAAIGGKTKETLIAEGWSSILCPNDKFNSEALLALPEFQSITNRSILIVTGKNGRQHLADILEQRGAKVQFAICYERQVPAYPSSIIMHIKQNNFAFIVCSSNESLLNLSDLLQKDLRNLQQSQIIGFSERLVPLAAELGFLKKPIIAATASDEAIVAAIVKNL